MAKDLEQHQRLKAVGVTKPNMAGWCTCGQRHLQHLWSWHLAQLPERRTDTPTTVHEVVVSSVAEAAPRKVVSLAAATRSDVGEVILARPEPQPIVDDSNRMVAKTLRAAAISDLRLHPDRKGEIESRVKSIRSLQEAGAYIEEVEKELESAGAEA